MVEQAILPEVRLGMAGRENLRTYLGFGRFLRLERAMLASARDDGRTQCGPGVTLQFDTVCITTDKEFFKRHARPKL